MRLSRSSSIVFLLCRKAWERRDGYFMGKINYLNIDKDIDKTNIEKQVKIYESKFPIVIDNITYNIFGDIDITHANKNCYIYYFNLIDNEGYKYYLNYSNIIAVLNTKILLNRFFKRNKYTYDNINLYCALNNIDLHINGDGLPISGASREKMDYFDSNNVLHKVSWNQIQHYSFRYKNNYNEIKQNNKIQRELSKQEVINIVFEMQKRKGSPLNIYDFYPKQKNGVGIRTIRKYWDELWLMQKDLGLKITGKHESILSDEEVLKEIDYICDFVKTIENRTTITHKDLKKHGTYSDYKKYSEACKNLKNCTLREYIESLGLKLQQSGNGMNYKFEDGENVVSFYEYEFSSFLRDNGFIFSQTYFRNIPYKDLDNLYKGKMNCDYEIILNGNKIYIELAGILGNKEHQKAYRNNIKINSKSKELYRQKLYQKRDIFERNNLAYYILLPDEMNIQTYKNILNKRLGEAV